MVYWGLAPEDNFQLAQADMLAGVISELEDKLSAAIANEDQEKKARNLHAQLYYTIWSAL